VTIERSTVALTIDVEGDYGTSSLRGTDEALPALLERLADRGAQAVLFAVGEVARRRPALLRRAVALGHAVGSHSMSHARLSSLARSARRAEIGDSRRAIEDASGVGCLAFRAPFFDAPVDLGPLLEEAGYRWSSSTAPFSWAVLRPSRLLPRLAAARTPHRLGESGVVEFPVSGLLGCPIPDGLAYRRLLWPLSTIGRRPPSVFYLHPYEFLPRVEAFGHPSWVRPFMTRRRGRAAEHILWSAMNRWCANGAVIRPPDPIAVARAATPRDRSETTP
jgi:hypothetical protein